MGFVDDGSHYRQQIEVTFIWAIYFDYVKTVYPDYEYKMLYEIKNAFKTLMTLDSITDDKEEMEFLIEAFPI